MKAFLTKFCFVIFIFILAISSERSYGEIEKPQKYFDFDNFLIINSQRFFPIGIFGVTNYSEFEEIFKEIKSAGFNSVQSYKWGHNYLRSYIRTAEKVGLKTLVYPGFEIKEAKDKINIDDVKNTLKDFKSSSTILAWYLRDEPDPHNISPQKLKKEIELIHEIDPIHPTSMVISNPKSFDNYAEASDILICNPYPVPKRPVTIVAQYVNLARNAVNNKKPVWAVLQAFGYQNEKYRGWGWEREPTFEEMKAMTYLAVTQGVRGIFYYAYGCPNCQYYIKYSSRHWEGLKNIVKELKAIYPLLVSNEVKDVVSVVSDLVDGKASPFWTVRRVSKGNPLIKEGTYLIVVNGLNRSVKATYKFNKRVSESVKVVLEDRYLKLSESRLTDSFKPYEVHIYFLK